MESRPHGSQAKQMVTIAT